MKDKETVLEFEEVSLKIDKKEMDDIFNFEEEEEVLAISPEEEEGLPSLEKAKEIIAQKRDNNGKFAENEESRIKWEKKLEAIKKEFPDAQLIRRTTGQYYIKKYGDLERDQIYFAKKFESEDELVDRIYDYFNSLVRTEKKILKGGRNAPDRIEEYEVEDIPTPDGLAVHLGMSKQTLVNYAETARFGSILRQTLEYINSQQAAALANGRGNALGLMFLLKNNADYTDKTETNTTIHNTFEGISTEDLKRRLGRGKEIQEDYKLLE